ncbi:MAG: hypothetical protein II940_01460 [Methanosarcinaceae archaeon]|nr:hypothetical protein [Methanosarcinaceae archaeon]
MDEATAFRDTESESKAQEALSGLISDKAIIIARRLRTVREADRIGVLKGFVAKQGNPEELCQQGAFFADMVRLQTDSGNQRLRSEVIWKENFMQILPRISGHPQNFLNMVIAVLYDEARVGYNTPAVTKYLFRHM